MLLLIMMCPKYGTLDQLVIDNHLGTRLLSIESGRVGSQQKFLFVFSPQFYLFIYFQFCDATEL
jgi:hypothetical protein